MAEETVLGALRQFANSVQAKLVAGGGQPEAQLVGPTQQLLQGCAAALSLSLTAVAETSVSDVGRPDVGVHVAGALSGYLELKAIGVGADSARFRDHDREQFKRFTSLPNVLYTDGQEWALYRSGERVGSVLKLQGDLKADGGTAVTQLNADSLKAMLSDFFSWQPIVPSSAPQLARLLAPLCRFLAISAEAAIGRNPDGAVSAVFREWRQLLFPEADEAQFADGYAQTVTFAFLLARVEGSSLVTVDDAVQRLGARHSLLGEVLRNIATSPQVRQEVGTAIDVLQRVTQAVKPGALASHSKDAWLYFYEDFLAAYNPQLREDRGAYYTPHQVVGCQTRLVQELLVQKLGLPRGFADENVVVLDPGAGTGTYPLGVLREGLRLVEQSEGPGAVAGRASLMGEQLCGFEILVGPYAVCQLRVTQAILDANGTLPPDGPRVYLIDTLESPHAGPAGQTTLLQKPLAEAHLAGLNVKAKVPVLVCIGNPPYDDQRDTSQSRKGGWVRFGEEKGTMPALLETFLKPLTDTGRGRYRRYVYNDYLYFWRWAIWKVCEQDSSKPGVVSFITAASYLRGIPYIGVREHMRREFDAIWIIDLEGDSFGPHKTENVFAIRTPVAIAVCVRYGAADRANPASVKYTKATGTRAEKYEALDSVKSFNDLVFEDCPSSWHAPFQPHLAGDYASWPKLTGLFPWRNPGSAAHRTWPVATDAEVLKERWMTLASAPRGDRAAMFGETRDRKVSKKYRPIEEPKDGVRLPAIEDLTDASPVPAIEPYAWRAFDRRWILADHRVLDTPRPPLWFVRGERQLYFTTLITTRLGAGPAILAETCVPDFNHFNNRACQVVPLYRDPNGKDPNLAAGLLDALSSALGVSVTADEFACYVYALLAHPGYEARFTGELAELEPRVPITANPSLFQEAVGIGKRLIWLHTRGSRFVDASEGRPSSLPPGQARLMVPIPNSEEHAPREIFYDEGSHRLGIGQGVVEAVSPDVYGYEVSGHHVVPYWIRARLAEPVGVAASPLDRIGRRRWTATATSQLLELLWMLERAVELEPYLLDLLDRVVLGETLAQDALPHPTSNERQEPAVMKDTGQGSLSV